MRYDVNGSPIPETAEELKELLTTEVPQRTTADPAGATVVTSRDLSLADLLVEVREAYCRYIICPSPISLSKFVRRTADTSGSPPRPSPSP
jgi:hypothetical protein